MYHKIVSRSEFEAAFNERIKGEFTHIRKSYRNQQLRKWVLLLIGVVSALVAVRFMLPPIMFIFFLIGFGIYFLLARKRTPRIEVDEEMRRMLFRRIAEMTTYPYSVHTHKFLSAQEFKNSELFDFSPDLYAGDEMIEIGENQQLAISQINAKEELDKFAERKPEAFNGWLIRLNRLADDNRTDWAINNLKLSGKWRDNLLPSAYYAAGNFDDLYSRNYTEVKLNRDSIWDFYRLIMWVLK